MKIIAPKRLMESVFPTVRNGGIFNASSLDLQFARTKTLDPRITFTRASSGTYVDSQGVIRTATTNLLLRSEEFNDVVWVKSQGSVTPNATSAPNGTITADQFIENTATSQHALLFGQTITANTTYTLSCYIKAAGRSTGWVQFNNSTYSSGVRAAFNLSAATATAVNFGTGSGAVASIASAGDGWYRVSIRGVIDASSTTGIVAIYLNDGQTYTGDGTSGLYLWGAQLEQSSTVGEYIPTTSTINSAPRFDHDPTTGESLGLLVEEQRTNICLQSENFSTTWTLTDATVSTNTVIAPDGTQSADKITVTVTTGVAAQAIVKAASTTTYTFTLFVKGSISALSFTVDAGGPANRGICVFNLSTGSLTSTANSGSFTGTTGSITPYSDGWYRLILTTTTGTETTVRPRLFWTGTNTTLDVWGAQLEAGAFPTSYIPTTSSTVTRSADVASISGTAFSSFYRQDEGTVFAETQLQSTAARNAVIVDINDTTTSNRNIIRALTTGSDDRLIIRSGNTTVASLSSGSGPGLIIRRTVGAYRVDDFSFTAQGLAPAIDTTGAVPASLTQMLIGSALSLSEPLGGTIRRLTYWPTRLPNSTLQAVTQ